MAFHWQRSARTHAGQLGQAINWAKELSMVANGRLDGLRIRFWVEQFGDTGAIHWTCEFDDLNHFNEQMAVLARDETYNLMVSRASDLLIGWSVHDRLVQEV